jgi:hypothetical protein
MASRKFFSDELVGQSAVCEVLGITERTLARRFARYKAEGDDSDIPPFIVVGKQRRWRYDYLIAFRDQRTAFRGLQSHGYPTGPAAQAGEEPQQHSRLSVGAIVRMIEGWKVRELHRRYEIIADPAIKTSDIFVSHQAERRLLFDEMGNRRNMYDPGVAEACRTKAQEIDQPVGTAYLPDQLAPLMRTVWEQVLETERGWLLTRT